MEEALRRPDDATVTPSADAAAPRGVPTRGIHERQLDEDLVLLQRAATVSHQCGQQLEALRILAAVVLALAGVVVTFTGHGRTIVSIVGFFWFAVSVVLLKALAGRTARTGAILQEMFDTALFYLPWHNTLVGDRIPDHEVHRLARSVRLGGERDERITDGWYVTTAGVHHPYDALIAHEQNLGWDSRLRRRYGYVIAGAAGAWTVAGIALGVGVPGTTVQQILLSFFIPSLSAYGLAHDAWLAQIRVAEQRERLAETVTTELQRGSSGPVEEGEWHRLRAICRDVQDGIFRTRLESTRVPEWFYKLFRPGDEHDFGASAEDHRRRLAGE
jgi:hypothetical protein